MGFCAFTTRPGRPYGLWCSGQRRADTVVMEFTHRVATTDDLVMLESVMDAAISELQQGFLSPHQSAWWDETEGGPGARIRYELPFTAAAQTGAFAREHLPELEKLLDFIATQVST